LIDKSQCAPCATDPKKECVADKLTREGKQCYQCIDRPQQCSDLGLLNIQECRACDQDLGKKCVEDRRTKEGILCFSCQEKSEACGKLNLLSALECEYRCTNCVEAQKAEGGEQCFSCAMQPGSVECLKNDYYRDCAACQEDEICEEVNLILFYESRRTVPLTCYSCSPK
jgi:hypothetical protein